jgi:glycosidase
MIYYGDEVGMYGADDPNNRQPMWWDDIKYDDPNIAPNADLLEHCARLIAIRNRWDCFRGGSCRTLLADDRQDLFAFARQGKDEAAVVAFNRSGEPRVAAVNVSALRDAHGSVQQWTDVLRERDYRIYNFRREGESVTRRGIRVNGSYPTRTRPDGTIEIALGPREAAILVSGTGQ